MERNDYYYWSNPPPLVFLRRVTDCLQESVPGQDRVLLLVVTTCCVVQITPLRACKTCCALCKTCWVDYFIACFVLCITFCAGRITSFVV
jgi:hypothetical protein